MYVEYEAIARCFAWTLTEVKNLTKREREYWSKVALMQPGRQASEISSQVRATA